jgi:hypothetical protein
MAELLELTSPVVGGAARLHHHRARRLLGEERADGGPRQASAPTDMARTVRNGELEDSLCYVGGNGGMVLHDGLLLFAEQRDFGTSMPIKS